MRLKLIAANWKMHGDQASNQRLISDIQAGLTESVSAEIVISAPFVYLEQVARELKGSAIKLAAQNVSEFEEGAYTGEVSASMLSDLDCEYALVGHSERRQLFSETNEQVANKFAALLKHSIQPILCVGESLEEREAEQTEQVVKNQLAAVIETLGVKALAKSVLAYEPVWAIGTGKTASPEQAQSVHKVLREFVAQHDKQIAENLRIVYGGSVNEKNAQELFEQEDIDGGLIGGASLKADSFLNICKVDS